MELNKLTKIELLKLAAEKAIPNRTKLLKGELVKALEPYFGDKNISASTDDKSLPKSSRSKKTATAPSSNIGYESKKPVTIFQIKKDEYPIPEYYNMDTLVILPVDPSKEYVYWELSDNTIYKVRQQYKLGNAPLVLKLYKQANDLSTNEISSVEVSRFGNWFFDIYAPSNVLWAELGFVDENGVFYSVLKSNSIRMPADKVSDIIDDETWMTIGHNIDKLYGLSGLYKNDLGASQSMHKTILRQLTTINAVSSSSFMKDK